MGNYVQRLADNGVNSIRENHQPGIEHDWEKDMTPSNDSERQNDGPVGPGNLPPGRKKAAREDSYHPKCEEADDECQPKPTQDPRDLDEEIGPLNFLFGRAPRDIIREEMRKQRLGQMD